MDEVTTFRGTIEKEDSLGKRYMYKLCTNVLGIGFNLVTQAVIPRGLGPGAYGDFNFLTSFFNEVVNFFDMGTSTAFYTKLSRRPREAGLVSFYLRYAGFASLITVGLAAILVVSPARERIWPGQGGLFVVLGAVFGVAAWSVQILNRMADAYGVTVSAEIVRMTQKALGVVLIVALYLLHQLNLLSFFFYHYLLLFLLGFAFLWVIKKAGYDIREGWGLSRNAVAGYTREFYRYSHPLFFYALIGLLVTLFDRWLLQFFSGSVQQGFFGLSYQIGAFCFLFTGAMTPLLTREFSIAFGKNDVERMAYCFRRYIPPLYSLAAYFSCFMAAQAEKAIYIMGGDQYREALTAVTIMSFYPIHQTYGQLSGSVFFATGQTGLYRNLGIASMVVGLPVTWILLAPHHRMGMNAGATGLAIKMVLLQFLGVNLQLYYNARFLGLSFRKFLSHQIVSVLVLFGLAMTIARGVDNMAGLHGRAVLSFMLSGFIYTLLVVLLLRFAPAVMGVEKTDVKLLLSKLRRQ
jgi:O-antigen/teichoic acid export membrane protein